MKNNQRIWIIAAILVIITGLSILFWNSGRRVSWLETYRIESRDPYGTFVIGELLKDYFPGQPFQVLSDSLPKQFPAGSGTPANYLFIGEGLLIDSTGIETLTDFVAAGNTAFIASRTLPNELVYGYLSSISCEEYFYWDDYSSVVDTVADLRLIHPGLSPEASFRIWHHYKRRHTRYRWQYLEPWLFCESDTGLVALGYFRDSLPNLARLPYGDGYFYLHSMPIAFTNVQLLEENALRYAERIFSHLTPGPIYWDEASKVAEDLARRRNRSDYSPPDRRLNPSSPLQYVLSQPALTWAWYLLLALSLLYLFFRAKRRQRIIPVIEQPANTSLEFVTTIGRLFFLQNDHKQLALQQMKLFRAFVHDHYALSTHDLDKAFIEKLAAKSEIPAAELAAILQLHQQITDSAHVTEQEMVRFHQKLEYFYKNCR